MSDVSARPDPGHATEESRRKTMRPMIVAKRKLCDLAAMPLTEYAAVDSLLKTSMFIMSDVQTAEALVRLVAYTDGKTEFVSTPDIKAALDEITWLNAELAAAKERAKWNGKT